MEKIFIAKIIWQIKITNNKLNSDFDEQLIIIRAENKNLALLKAQKLGQSNQESFQNIHGQNINWVFVNVEFVKEIVSFEDGYEICSQTISADDANQYINDINAKSMLNNEIFSF
jgi:hypothetical protein